MTVLKTLETLLENNHGMVNYHGVLNTKFPSTLIALLLFPLIWLNLIFFCGRIIPRSKTQRPQKARN